MRTEYLGDVSLGTVYDAQAVQHRKASPVPRWIPDKVEPSSDGGEPNGEEVQAFAVCDRQTRVP
jgi:hypothetical protein